MIRMDETKVEKTYFRGCARCGRTTTLVAKADGRRLGEYMGICTRKEAYRAYCDELARQGREVAARGGDVHLVAFAHNTAVIAEFAASLAR